MTTDPIFPAALTERYELQQPLGRGAMGVVYRALDRELRRTVAIKLIDPVLTDVDTRLRFVREARMLSRASHPHVVRLYEASIVGDLLYIAMEYLDGETLSEHLERRSLLPPEEARPMLAAMLGALEHIHGLGILHRDLKPSNVFLADRGPVIIDFGLARPADVQTLLTTAGKLLGTPRYFAPELLTGSAPSVRSDLFGLGFVGIRMLSDVDPFSCGEGQPGSVADILSSLTSGSYVAAARKALSDAGPLGRALLTAIERDPAARYGSAAAMKQALEEACPPAVPEQRPTAAARPAGHGRVRSRRSSPGSRPRPGLWWRGLAVAVLSVFAVAVALALHTGRPSPRTGAAMEPSPSTRPRSPAPDRSPLVPVLDVRVRPLEDSVFVLARTPTPARLEAQALGSACGKEIRRTASSGPGYVHRFVLGTLPPDTSLVITLRARDPGTRVEVERSLARTRPAGFRERTLGILGQGLGLLKRSRRGRISLLREVGADTDVPELIRLAREQRNGDILQMVTALRQIASPLGVPTAIQELETGPDEHAPQRKVLEAILTLENVGSPEATEALSRFCTDGCSRGDPKLALWRDWMRSRAARALVRIAPARALSLFDRLRSVPEHAPVAIAGAAFLGPPWLPVELERVCRPGQGGSPGLVRAAVAAAAWTGVAADRTLSVVAGRTDVAEDTRQSAVEGLGTWGDDRSAGVLLTALEPAAAASGRQGCWKALSSLGLLASRSSDPALRARVGRAIACALTGPDATTRRLALRSLALLGEPSVAARIEAEYSRCPSPRAEFALALVRVGSPRAREAIEAAIGWADRGETIRPTDLWLAAVAASALPRPVRSQLLERIGKILSRFSHPEVTEHLSRSLEWLESTGLPARAAWVDPVSPWTPVGHLAAPGRRFRVVAHGITAVRTSPRGAPARMSDPDELQERIADIAGPQGLARHYCGEVRVQALALRAGLQEITPPVVSGDTFVAQLDGPVMVKLAHGEPGEPGWFPDFGSPESTFRTDLFGLILVTVDEAS